MTKREKLRTRRGEQRLRHRRARNRILWRRLVGKPTELDSRRILVEPPLVIERME